MPSQYSYQWFIRQFENSRDAAKKFISSVDKQSFIQAPSEGKWSCAECYSHLVKYGNLYFDQIDSAISANTHTVSNSRRSFPPRWVAKKLIMFLKPPYKIKIKTLKPITPDLPPFRRKVLLDEYLNLQDRLIAQLERARRQQVHLMKAKVVHPLFPVIRMTLSECFLLLDIHQQRHQWQAEQTLEILKG